MILGKPAIVVRFINTCWSFFKLALIMALVAGLGLGAYLFVRMDDEIRRHVERTLAEQFPQFNISVGGARLVEGRGIALYDLTISETSNTQLQNHLLVVDEIMFACNAQLSQLAKGDVTVYRVEVKHPQLWISRRADGRWNLESFWPLPSFGDTRPQIVIKDAQIAVHDEDHLQLPPFVMREVNLTIDPSGNRPTQQASLQQVAHVSLAKAENTTRSMLPLEIHGTWGGPNIKRADFQVQIDPNNRSFHLDAKFEQLHITSEHQAWITAYAPSSLGQATFEGSLDGDVSVQHEFGVNTAPQFEAQLRLTGGRFDTPRLPQPLTEMSCNIHCDNTRARIQELRGNFGSASVAMQLERHGWKSTAPLAMGLRMENVPLDSQLYEALPSLVKDQWDKYKPTGMVSGELQLTFDGTSWRPIMTLTGRELAFESDKFRYRLNNGSGTLQYTPSEADKPAQLDINLIGHSGDQPLKIVGQVFDPRPGALGWVEITGQNVKIEQQMIDALPGKTHEVIKSMHPAGKFHLRWKLARQRQGQLKPDTSLRLELADCRVKYDHFPYPLNNIHGLILAKNDQWTFSELVSEGSRTVQCQGTLQPKGDGSELSLQFTGQQIPLDDDLKQALPESVRKAWTEIRPRGRVDLTATVLHETGFEKPSIHAIVYPRPKSATIYPTFFPYSLEQVEGTIDYQDGQVSLTDIRAQHDRTTVRTHGGGTFATDGAWQFQLTGLSADRLAVRRELIDALPQKLQKLIDGLKPTGSFRLHDGTLSFSKSREAAASINSRWDVELDCLQTDLQVGFELRNVSGSVRLEGSDLDGRCTTKGELALDSATFEDVQFTNIRGPLWVDETRCLLGRWATEIQRAPTRRLTAEAYGGYLVGDGGVSFDGLPEYQAQASLVGADLSRMMTERFHSQQAFSGKVAVNLNLRGRGRSLDNLTGDGDVKITDANIYELPILVGLLKVLRNSTPDSTAFNQSDMEFRIQGRHIYLDQLDFLGDAISLYGKGETNFDHELNLAFNGVVGRNESKIPLFRNLVGQASRGIMRMYVGGTLSDPEIQTQAFPGINNLIQQIQTDLDADGTIGEVGGPREAKRGFSLLPPWRGLQ